MKNKQYNTEEYEMNLKEDGYQKALFRKGDERHEIWALHTNQPFKGDKLILCLDGEKEVLALIQEEDLPAPDFYDFKYDEEIEYTSEEMFAIQKAKDHPNFSMNLHNFRKHCREKGIESTNRNFLKYMEDFNDQSEYVPTILNVKHSYAPTYDYDPDDTGNDKLDQEELPF